MSPHDHASIRPRSETAFADASKLLPGGVDSPVRAFRAVGGTPVFIKSGKGAGIRDVDGHRYIDFCQSWGAIILGHADRRVTRAVHHRLQHGSSFGAPTTEETRLASLIRDAIPSMERLRFVSSGTEAVMSALRVARAWTNRPFILKFDGCYHGHADHLLVNAGSGVATLGIDEGKSPTSNASSAGVPEAFASLTLSVPYNDIAAVRASFAAHPGQIAAIIVEPVAANMGPVYPEAAFLSGLRQICDAEGALLVFDEVITGFRVAPGGAQQLFGIKPDLTTLGKIIGGGLPAGAYGGRADLMNLVAPNGPVYQAGTLSGNPAAMTAGIKVLERLKDGSVYHAIQDRSMVFDALMREGLDTTHFHFAHFCGLFTLFCAPGPILNYADARRCDTARYGRIFNQLLQKGIYWAPSQFEANFIGAAHRKKDLRRAAAAFHAVLNSPGIMLETE